jgi:hypothetical protein
MEKGEKRGVSGKWVVLGLILISMVMATLRWVFVPKTNPRQADPGNPFYSPPKSSDHAAPKPPQK